MKNIMFTFFILFALCSCKKQVETVTLPADKLYILNYHYSLPEEGDMLWALKFHIEGFCELDNNFNLKCVRKLSCYRLFYHKSQTSVPDSMRNKISNILLKYQTDTTFLYQEEWGPRLYSGGYFRFIMQKHNKEDITIKFEPEYLPEDLKFVFSYLYDDRERTVHISEYDELFDMFRDMAKDDEVEVEMPPPPPYLQ